MNLVCTSQTPQELRDTIVTELLHRAWQERAVSKIGLQTFRNTVKHEHAAIALENLANDLKRMELAKPGNTYTVTRKDGQVVEVTVPDREPIGTNVDCHNI